MDIGSQQCRLCNRNIGLNWSGKSEGFPCDKNCFDILDAGSFLNTFSRIAGGRVGWKRDQETEKILREGVCWKLIFLSFFPYEYKFGSTYRLAVRA